MSASGMVSRAKLLLAPVALIFALMASIAPAAHAEEPISQFSLVPSSNVAGAHGNLDVHLRFRTGLFPPVPPEFGFPEIERPYGLHLPQTIATNLPPGLLANPTAFSACTDAVLAENFRACPNSAQIGTIDIHFDNGYSQESEENHYFPLFNMTRGPEQVARFGFAFLSGLAVIHFVVHVRDGSDYGATVTASELPTTFTLYDAKLDIWGDPGAAEHDTERASCYNGESGTEKFECGAGVRLTSQATYLVNPPECAGGASTVDALFWDLPGQSFEGPASPFPALTGCSSLPFEPSLAVGPPAGSLADQPAGYAADLTIPQQPNEDAGAQATAFLKNLTVKLPAGTAISPAAAQGLGACTDAQLGLGSEAPATCPESSKIGTVSVHSPLLERELSGDVYVGSQLSSDPTSGQMYRVFLVPEGQGVRAKLVGSLSADPTTGQLTATFANNPRVPFDHLHLQLNGGPRAPLANPSTCGTYATTGELVPWSSPETPTRTATSSFALTGGPGGHCAFTEAGQPAAPTLEAGTTEPRASTYSPLVFKLARADGTQRIGSLTATLPEGLLARLAGIPYCSAAQIAAAEAQSGAAAQATPACPAASQVGTVDVGAGPGTQPLNVSGNAYLAGPYKGAPLSLVFVTPAVAGPFDLGTVVVRAALEVDPYTTQVTVRTDPIPTIVKGVPLDLRSLALNVDRPNFTRNPSSCGQGAITAAVTSPAGTLADPRTPFAATGCEGLAFSPRLALALSGPTHRGGHPALRATLHFPPSRQPGANVASAQVALPHSEFLDQGNIGKVCTQAELKAAACPKGSVYGHAKAYSPLLAKPLEGPVFLAVGFGHKLPDLVAELNGQIRVLLDGRIDTDPQGGIRTTFSTAPDAPISRFVLSLKGGAKQGLLENSEDVCGRARSAGARFVAHDGVVYKGGVALTARCGKQR